MAKVTNRDLVAAHDTVEWLNAFKDVRDMPDAKQWARVEVFVHNGEFLAFMEAVEFSSGWSGVGRGDSYDAAMRNLAHREGCANDNCGYDHSPVERPTI